MMVAWTPIILFFLHQDREGSWSVRVQLSEGYQISIVLVERWYILWNASPSARPPSCSVLPHRTISTLTLTPCVHTPMTMEDIWASCEAGAVVGRL